MLTLIESKTVFVGLWLTTAISGARQIDLPDRLIDFGGQGDFARLSQSRMVARQLAGSQRPLYAQTILCCTSRVLSLGAEAHVTNSEHLHKQRDASEEQAPSC